MSRAALEGIRVLDFSRLLPGPYCTWLLADMGADVIRVENPRELEKQAAVFGWDRLTPEERTRLRERDILARNKRSLKADMGDAGVVKLLHDLISTVDVVVEDYRPGVLDGLGLGYEALSSINPRLVYCSLTLCGQSGPYRDKPGHDPVALSIAGVTSRLGEDPDEPGFAGVPAADVVTGTHAAFGILAALRASDQNGQGQHIDIAMSDCSMSLLVNVLSRHADMDNLPARGDRRADMGLWRTADDRFICTTDMEPRYWRRFCQVVGREDYIPLQNDIESRPAIRAALSDIFRTKTRSEWLAVLELAGTQFAPVYSVSEAMQDPHNRARGMAMEYPSNTGDAVFQLGSPLKLSRTPASIRHLGRVPGSDTRAILNELGLSKEEVEKLIKSKSVMLNE
ncbi:CaiB/BaiF CoA transferase family protein [Saccharospirillum sp.]|uniref:CaiB/BaiF CoA transferase family protein n=1 Tax=Saccharospirillum sp. TaxID=2033801 RepID=UPI0034A03F71